MDIANVNLLFSASWYFNRKAVGFRPQGAGQLHGPVSVGLDSLPEYELHCPS